MLSVRKWWSSCYTTRKFMVPLRFHKRGKKERSNGNCSYGQRRVLQTNFSPPTYSVQLHLVPFKNSAALSGGGGGETWVRKWRSRCIAPTVSSGHACEQLPLNSAASAPLGSRRGEVTGKWEDRCRAGGVVEANGDATGVRLSLSRCFIFAPQHRRLVASLTQPVLHS